MTPLQPTAPPGRITRKARGFGAEIARLRRQGYTLDAIRQALTDAGIQVSISTVWREARRVDGQALAEAVAVVVPLPGTAPSRNAPDSLQTPASSATRLQSPRLSPADVITPALVPCSGKEFADIFMSTQVTNPLFRSKE
ncbi:MAG: hypothetical protein K2W93_14500 [Burkholderiaceae bacterium]|nr:hypothetical protein [Burkholderiaceae bacterium]